LKETIDFFDTHFPGTTISFSPVHSAGRGLSIKEELVLDQEDYCKLLTEAILHAENTSVKLLTKYKQAGLAPRRHYCASTAKPNWNVNINGEIYACMEAKNQSMKIGRIDFQNNSLELDYDRIKMLQEMTIDQKYDCKDCFAKYLCVGGCVVVDDNTDTCDEIKDRLIYTINKSFDEKEIIKAGQRLFKIDYQIL
jgi:radical SAM protein with 4Fe4S-binding SPASM domain